MDDKKKCNCSIAICDSPSKSTSVCSSPLPFSALSLIPTIPTTPTVPEKLSVEEIWKNINLPSFHQTNTTTSSTASTAQEGLSRLPYDSSFVNNGLFESQELPAETLLSLNSRTEFDYVESSDSLSKAPSSFTLPPSDALNSSIVKFSILPKKRVPERDDSSGGHRSKRMIKNRESAARSRARKQAYTKELEIKVSRLMEENGRLRRQLQLEKLCTTAPVQFPKKHKLRRTLTAPF